MKETSFSEAPTLAALAHKLYLQASHDQDWIGMLICWAVILKLES